MEKIVLDNGLTVALFPDETVHSASVCFYVAAGNRYEKPGKSGISHYIEHMVFKGTSTRSARNIAEQSDIMGGQLNAYTAKEYTCFYSRALTEHVGKMLNLMCDMLCNPLFDRKDMDSERGVITEEIGMYEDSPEDLCADLLNALCYKDKPLGFNILGTRESVAALSADDLRCYMEYAYAPERIVVSLCGNYDRDSVLETLEHYFGNRKNSGNPVVLCADRINNGYSLCHKKIEQTQLAVSFNGMSETDPLKYACSFFTSISGGASSSRINRRIREELGLAYSVYTFSSSYLGTGIFGLSAGLAPKNQEKFLREGLKILTECAGDVTEAEIELTREQFKAGTVLSGESMSAIAASAGRQLLLEGRYVDIDGILREIDSVTPEQIREAARRVTDPETVAVAVVGDAKDESFYKGIIESVMCG